MSILCARVKTRTMLAVVSFHTARSKWEIPRLSRRLLLGRVRARIVFGYRASRLIKGDIFICSGGEALPTPMPAPLLRFIHPLNPRPLCTRDFRTDGPQFARPPGCRFLSFSSQLAACIGVISALPLGFHNWPSRAFTRRRSIALRFHAPKPCVRFDHVE